MLNMTRTMVNYHVGKKKQIFEGVRGVSHHFVWRMHPSRNKTVGFKNTGRYRLSIIFMHSGEWQVTISAGAHDKVGGVRYKQVSEGRMDALVNDPRQFDPEHIRREYKLPKTGDHTFNEAFKHPGLSDEIYEFAHECVTRNTVCDTYNYPNAEPLCAWCHRTQKDAFVRMDTGNLFLCPFICSTCERRFKVICRQKDILVATEGTYLSHEQAAENMRIVQDEMLERTNNKRLMAIISGRQPITRHTATNYDCQIMLGWRSVRHV